MNLAYISLAGLVLAILVSCFTELNVGILALALAWIVGVYVGGMPLNDVIAGFPVSLFLTLSGVTLLFSQAQLNRTLDRIAHRHDVDLHRCDPFELGFFSGTGGEAYDDDESLHRARARARCVPLVTAEKVASTCSESPPTAADRLRSVGCCQPPWRNKK